MPHERSEGQAHTQNDSDESRQRVSSGKKFPKNEGWDQMIYRQRKGKEGKAKRIPEGGNQVLRREENGRWQNGSEEGGKTSGKYQNGRERVRARLKKGGGSEGTTWLALPRPPHTVRNQQQVQLASRETNKFRMSAWQQVSSHQYRLSSICATTDASCPSATTPVNHLFHGARN